MHFNPCFLHEQLDPALHPFLQAQLINFNFAQSADKKSVEETGEAIMVLLYGGQSGITLDKLRFHLFQKMVATANTTIVSESLPPT